MTDRHKAILLLLLVSFIGGSLGVAQKIGLQDISPLGFVASRVILSLIFIIPFLIKSKPKLNKNYLKLFLFSTLAVGNITLFIIGISRTLISMAAILYTAVPLITAIFSYLLYNDKLTTRKMIGVFIGMLGTVLVAISPLLKETQDQSGSFSGNLIIFSAVVTFSLYTALSKKIQKDFSPMIITSAFIITGVVVLSPLALWEAATTSNWLVSLNLKSLLIMLYVSLIGTVGFYFLYQEAVKKASPLIASLTLYLMPLIATALAVIVLKEQLSRTFFIGAGLALLGIWLVTFRQKKQIIVEEAKVGV